MTWLLAHRAATRTGRLNGRLLLFLCYTFCNKFTFTFRQVPPFLDAIILMCLLRTKLVKELPYSILRVTTNGLIECFKELFNMTLVPIKDYLELGDWGAREVKRNKRGYIPANAPAILFRTKMDAAPVLDYLAKDDLPAFGTLGPASMLRVFAKSVGRRFIKGHVLGDRPCPERA